MLKLTIPESSFWDSEKQVFVDLPSVDLELEHSLLSLSKWESKYHKPFLGKDEKSPEEISGYVEAMIVTPDYPSGVVDRLSQDNINTINEYINDPQTATTVHEMSSNKPGKRQTVTSELVYYWMVSYQIPIECETWHFNRLISLIKIANVKNQDPKKSRRSKSEVARDYRELNERRRAEMGTKG